MTRRMYRFLIVAGLVAPAIVPLATRASDCDGCGDRGCHAGTVADEFVADRFGLVREWIVRLPFASTAGQLEHVTVGDGLVVATAGDGSVHAIAASRRAPAQASGGQPPAPAAPDGAAPPAGPRPAGPALGSVLWSARLGTDSVQLPAGIGGNTVAVGGDLGIVALGADRGGVRWRQNVGTPAAAAVPVGDSVYMPLADGSIQRTLADPMRTAAAKRPAAEPAKAGRAGEEEKERRPRRDRRGAEAAPSQQASDAQLPPTVDGGGRLAMPVLPFGTGIAWTTTNGLLVALDRTKTGWDRHEFDLLSAPVTAPLVRGRSIFVATVGGDLARVDLPATGPRSLRTGWHTPLDGRPDAGPFLGGNTLLISLGDDGLAAFAADTGRPLWRCPVAGTVLAVGGDRAWLIDRVGRLSGIDLATGERRVRLCLGCLTVPIVNNVTDRLLLASADGLLVSLAPKRSIPDAFPGPTPAEPTKKKPRAGRAPEPEAEAAEPAAADADE